MKRKILKMLRNAKNHVSGQEICDALGVSRTAVWKAVNALKAEGYGIEAVQNRGYRLVDAPDVLTEAEIGSFRRDIWAEAPLVVFGETDSTNTQANLLAESGSPEGTLVVADVQTSGKGRRGRTWINPPGQQVAMSFILRPHFAPDRASMLTLIAAMAGRGAIAELTGTAPAIKWPNDLVMNGRKLCGILTEMKLEEYDIAHIIVGMGFNVGQEEFPEELADRATSLFRETGKRWSRAALCALVMDYFARYYRRFEEEQNLGFLREEYNACLAGLGKEVRVLAPEAEWTGTSLGINEAGELLVRHEGGEVEALSSGEISVRGIYGYV